MEVVIDTSALLAVILGEPERERIIALTTGNTLAGPACIRWEVGNAFSSILRRKRMPVAEVRKAIKVFEGIPIRHMPVDLDYAIQIANAADAYAYDAYFLASALRFGVPLLTLDAGLRHAAAKLGIRLMEV